MRKRRMSAIRMGLLGAVFAALPIAAQTSSGVIRGTIQDATRSAVPKAKVTLRNQDTNIGRETSLSVAGIYYFGDIQPGKYELTVEAEGFKKWVGTLALEVGQTAVIDPTLEVGSLTATVEVTAATPVITLEACRSPTSRTRFGFINCRLTADRSAICST